MDVNIVKNFQTNLVEVDSIFSTSNALREQYLTNLRSLVNIPLTNEARKVLSNSINALGGISETSIGIAESKSWNRLYAQALILVVSISEQMLKDIFENLLFANIDSIDVLDNKPLLFGELRRRGVELSRADVIELLKEKIYDEKNPAEKINFQNIKTIEGIFEGYFRIKLNIAPQISKNLHFYYQCRHVCVHNAMIIDNRFVKNLLSAGVTRTYETGDRLVVDRKLFEECKMVFTSFFECVESAVKSSDLKYESVN